MIDHEALQAEVGRWARLLFRAFWAGCAFMAFVGILLILGGAW